MANEDRRVSILNQERSHVAAGLQEALLRLTRPGQEALETEVSALRAQIDEIHKLTKNISDLEENLKRNALATKENLNQVQDGVQAISQDIEKLTKELTRIQIKLENQIEKQNLLMAEEFGEVRETIDDLDQVSSRVGPVLTPLVHDQARTKQTEFAEAVAPAIGPAIRHQLRSAQQDIIDALYPVIGQIISKAIAESIQELTRKIDSRLKSQFNFSSRIRLFFWRLRGVTDTELIFRESVPYQIHHIFLIHQNTGLLLDHQALIDSAVRDPDLISGMLTAIQDFVGESFDQESSKLEDVTYGDQRILIESGQYAYLAVVLEGIEPPGFAHMMRDVIHEINLDYESELLDFQGDMENLPNFAENITPLKSPSAQSLAGDLKQNEMSKQEQLFVVVGVFGAVIVLALIIFACIFTIRLWPVAFGSP